MISVILCWQTQFANPDIATFQDDSAFVHCLLQCLFESLLMSIISYVCLLQAFARILSLCKNGQEGILVRQILVGAML